MSNTRRLAAIQTALDAAQERLYILETDVEHPTERQMQEYDALNARIDRLHAIAYRARYTRAERAARAEADYIAATVLIEAFRRSHGLVAEGA